MVIKFNCAGGLPPPRIPPNRVASLLKWSRFAPLVESLRSTFPEFILKNLLLFIKNRRNMERSDSTNGAKRLHLWSEATLFGGVRGGASPPAQLNLLTVLPHYTGRKKDQFFCVRNKDKRRIMHEAGREKSKSRSD